MTVRTSILLSLLASVAVLGSASAAPSEVPPARVGTHQKAQVLDTVVSFGSTTQARAVPLEPGEAAQAPRAELPQVPEDAFLEDTELADASVP